jgi:hypothetical protein
MNKQTEILVDKAGLTAVYEMFEDELKTFAELIVQECIDICLRNATAKDLDRWSAGVCI